MSRQTIAVFGASTTRPGDADWDDAVRLGRELAERGFDIATGGYGGTMEAASQGAAAAGAGIIGVTAPLLFPQRPGANRHVTQEYPARTLTERIGLLLSLTQGVAVLPGSLGTFTELMVAWNELFIRDLSDQDLFPVVAVGAPWGRLLSELAAALGTDGSLVSSVASVDAAVAELHRLLG